MFHFGADYYPEQWPEKRWSIDAGMMAEAGFNVVRLAEFAWSKLEPSEGEFDFSWLDRAMAILAAHGIRFVLGTPTASAPPWLMQKSVDLLRVGPDGRRLTYGNRREYCPNQPLYQEHARCIVTAMAEHYAGRPDVIGWQIDNEFGDRCFCPTCQGKFHDWLRSKYESLDDLNQKWGTTFWSHVYNDWAEIPLPLISGGSPNPALALDYCRFCSDSYVAFQRLQADILRAKCPGCLITHNLMGFGYDKLNYFDLGADLDLVSLDEYPRSQWSVDPGTAPHNIALDLAAMRGLKQRNFWVIEQQAGPGGWEMISRTPRPGEMRLWAYQSIAHGADAILFFRWRSARSGTEQYWHGILDHDAHAGRRYGEACRMGAELRRAGDQIAGSVVRSPVAMLLSYDSRFAFQIQPNNPLFSYAAHFQDIYQALYSRHVSVDILPPHADLSSYKLVVAPALHVLTERCAENLRRFVKQGGNLLVTQRSGVKDESNTVVDQRLPGLLAEVCGVEVEEYDSLGPGRHNVLEYALPEWSEKPAPTVGTLCEILQPTTASVAARYTREFYALQPAITVNGYGEGQAVYVGALGDQTLYGTLADWLLEQSGIKPVLTHCDGLEVTERWQGGRQLLFVLNHGDCSQEVTLDRPRTNLLDGHVYGGVVDIGPRDVLVLAGV